MSTELNRHEAGQGAVAAGMGTLRAGMGARLAPALSVAHGSPRMEVQSAPPAPHAHPSAEHFLPRLFVPGAALPEDRFPPVSEGFLDSSLSMRGFALRG